MDLDVNRILKIYKEKLADLEHEAILQRVLIEQLEAELKKMKEEKDVD